MRKMTHVTFGRLLSALLLSALFMLVPALVLAETVVRTGDAVSIGVNQTVEENFYAAAGTISHSGEVKGDMYVVGGTVTVNGPVGEDFTAVGGTVQAHANIRDDVRIISGDSVIAGEVGGDLFVIGGHLQLLSSAKVNGNVYFYGGEAVIEGEVGGDVMGSAERFVINGSVAGIDVMANRMALGDQARVSGDIRYQSANDLERAAGAEVDGEVMKTELNMTETPSAVGGGAVFLLITWFLAGLVAFLLLRGLLERMLRDIKNDPARTVLLGAAGMIVAPILAVILIVTVLGSWLGVALFFAYALLLMTSLIFMPILLGGYLTTLYRKNERVDFWSVLVGFLVLALLMVVPIIGGLLILAGLWMVFGVLLKRFYSAVKSLG